LRIRLSSSTPDMTSISVCSFGLFRRELRFQGGNQPRLKNFTFAKANPIHATFVVAFKQALRGEYASQDFRSAFNHHAGVFSRVRTATECERAQRRSHSTSHYLSRFRCTRRTAHRNARSE